MPEMRTTLLRLLSPAAMVMDERGTFKSMEKKRIQASFARPSIAGAVSSSFNASPTMPEMRSRLALGWTLTRKVTPFVCRTMGIK